MQYRKEIDGLRAIAVLPVILFHAGFSWFSGGFIGVDVFFVISGYLITTIVLREINAGTFSIVDFYERRARRILPLLFVVIAVCLPFAWMWMLPEQLKGFGRSIIAVVIFGSNILFWKESGYFAAASEEKPLLHTWSLAVEEQYYVIYPLLLVLLWRLGFGWRKSLSAIVILALASFGFTEWAWRNYPTANFYLLPSRAWELLGGSILGFWMFANPPVKGKLAEIGGATGLIFILIAIFAFDDKTPFPSYYGLLPVLGTILVILCAVSGTLAGRLLSVTPLVGIGLISYSAYMWHQPLFAFARIRSFGELPSIIMLLLTVFTLLLAWISWKYVEKPFRNSRLVSRESIFRITVFGAFILLCIGFLLHIQKGVPERLSKETLKLTSFIEEYNPVLDGCQKVQGGITKKHCAYGAAQDKRAVLWGDSHGLAIANSLSKGLGELGYGLESLAQPACLPSEGIVRLFFKACAETNLLTLNYLRSEQSPQLIFLVSRWVLNLDSSRFDNKEGGVEVDRSVYYYPSEGPFDKPIDTSEVQVAIRAVVSALLDAGKVVVVLGNIPENGWHVPNMLIKKSMFKGGPPRPLTTSAQGFNERNKSTKITFEMFRQHENFIWIEPSEVFCDVGIKNRCVAEIGGLPLYRDDDHVNAAGSKMITEHVINRLLMSDTIR